MEVEACEDFLYIMFNPLRQILFILYRCQIHNTFSPCAAQKVNLKHEKCHTLCSTVMKNLMSKFNPTSIKLNMFFLFLCSVVTGLPTTKAPPLTLSKMGKRETGWRGGLYLSLIHI